MQKTKLGISVGLLGAAVYLLTGFSGYTVALLIAGYVLLFEENEWLKKACVKAVTLAVCFTVLSNAIGLIPDILGWVSSLANLFNGYFNYSVVSNIISLITRTLDIIRTCLFLLGLQALNQGSVSIPVVDKLIDKYF